MPRSKAAPSPLAKVRLDLSDRPSQGWVADRVSDITGEEVSQQAVGYWETGKVDLRNVHPRRLRAYAQVLKLSLAELAEKAGHTFVELFPDEPSPARSLNAAERMGWKMPEQEYVPEIPDALQEAIALYGDRHPDLLDPRWQLTLADADFREEPETPEDWLALSSKLRKLINPRK